MALSSSPRCRKTMPRLFSADRKSTRLNSSHSQISYAVFCLKKKTRRIAKAPTEAHPDAHTELDHTNALELTVPTILSPQTTDQGVTEVTPQLVTRYRTHSH